MANRSNFNCICNDAVTEALTTDSLFGSIVDLLHKILKVDYSDFTNTEWWTLFYKMEEMENHLYPGRMHEVFQVLAQTLFHLSLNVSSNLIVSDDYDWFRLDFSQVEHVMWNIHRWFLYLVIEYKGFVPIQTKEKIGFILEKLNEIMSDSNENQDDVRIRLMAHKDMIANHSLGKLCKDKDCMRLTSLSYRGTEKCSVFSYFYD